GSAPFFCVRVRRFLWLFYPSKNKHDAPLLDKLRWACEKVCNCVMISTLRTLSEKLAPKRNYFGAISEKFMRQIEKFLARSSCCFWRHVFVDLGS
ncbi:hypothetical protein, partial [Porphyromonas loveana]